MKEDKKKKTRKELADIRVDGTPFKRAIDNTHLTIVSQSVRVPATKTVTEQVDTTVTTFLTDDSSATIFSRYQLLKQNRKRLPIRWAPFERG